MTASARVIPWGWWPGPAKSPVHKVGLQSNRNPSLWMSPGTRGTPAPAEHSAGKEQQPQAELKQSSGQGRRTSGWGVSVVADQGN